MPAPLRRLATLALVALAALPGLATAQADDACPQPPAPPGHRLLVVVSDHHMGAGRQAAGGWDPMEDFRWAQAWRGFLERTSQCGRDAVDLVVAGDLLELWQPPADLACKGGPNPDLGCTPEELVAITRHVIRAHGAELRELGRFAALGSNRVVLIPGNHDAALMLPEPWTLLHDAIAAPAGRVTRADDGLVRWDEGRVLVEHGHQIGNDANRYAQWPVITREHDGQTYVVRPWGERFVQTLFNDQEAQYPVIDNLSPEAAGARYRMADRGLWKSASDVARFLAFNLFETSMAQAGQFLGEEGEAGAWDLALGRKLGHRLFADALAADDPFRAALLDATPEGAELRAELDRRLADPALMPDTEVASLCTLAEQRTPDGVRCAKPSLGAMGDKLLRRPKREILAEHLRQRLGEPGLGAMRVFIYGHTHELETPWPVQATDLRRVTVLNSGAFQRVVSEAGFLQRAKDRGLAPAEALRKLTVADLPACYTAVFAWAQGAQPQAQTLRWHQAEDGAAGRFVAVGDDICR